MSSAEHLVNNSGEGRTRYWCYLHTEHLHLPSNWLCMVQKGKMLCLFMFIGISIGCSSARGHAHKEKDTYICSATNTSRAFTPVMVLLSSSEEKFNILYENYLYEFVALLWGFSCIPIAKETKWALIHYLHIILKYSFPCVWITENYNINKKEWSQVAHKNLHFLGDSQHFF